MGQAAHNGAPVADGDMTDQRESVGDRGAAEADRGIQLHVALPAERAHDQAIVGDAVVGETFDAVQVDDHGGPREAEVEQRHQALTARERPGFRAVPRDQRDRLGKVRRCCVIEGGGLHIRPRLSAGPGL